MPTSEMADDQEDALMGCDLQSSGIALPEHG
jgi:hypothetical protein